MHIDVTSEMSTYEDSEGIGGTTANVLFWLIVDGAIDLLVFWLSPKN
jgi:hypothetical protein